MKEPKLLFCCLGLLFTAGLLSGCGGREEKTTIMLDAGHDPTWPGTQAEISEEAYTLQLAQTVGTVLEESGRYEVTYTRTEEESLPVAERVRKIDEEKPDLVLSFHGDAIGSGDDRSQICILADVPQSPQHEASLQAAQALRQAFTQDGQVPFTGYLYYVPLRNETYQIQLVSSEDTAVHEEETLDLMSASVPVVQISLIRPDSAADREAWAGEAGMQDAADRILNGLDQFCASRSPSPTPGS